MLERDTLLFGIAFIIIAYLIYKHWERNGLL